MPRIPDDLTGRRFGRLVVIERAANHITIQRDRYGHCVGKKEYSCWLCKCDCGNTHVAYANHLKAGKVKSCGCLRAETAGKVLSEIRRRNHAAAL